MISLSEQKLYDVRSYIFNLAYPCIEELPLNHAELKYNKEGELVFEFDDDTVVRISEIGKGVFLSYHEALAKVGNLNTIQQLRDSYFKSEKIET